TSRSGSIVWRANWWAWQGGRIKRSPGGRAPHDRPATTRQNTLRTRLLPQLERLDHVVHLHVRERPEPDTALVPFADLGRVVLEPLERLDRQVVPHDLATAQHPGLGVAPHETGADQGTGDRAGL